MLIDITHNKMYIQGGPRTTAILRYLLSQASHDRQSSYFMSLKFEGSGLVWCIKHGAGYPNGSGKRGVSWDKVKNAVFPTH